MHHENWVCSKCGNGDFDTGEFRATGGMLAKLFDVQNKRFTTVSCTRCHFTEIYRSDSSSVGNLFDLFTG